MICGYASPGPAPGAFELTEVWSPFLIDQVGPYVIFDHLGQQAIHGAATSRDQVHDLPAAGFVIQQALDHPSNAMPNRQASTTKSTTRLWVEGFISRCKSAVVAMFISRPFAFRFVAIRE
jgi:hypothetical protein